MSIDYTLRYNVVSAYRVRTCVDCIQCVLLVACCKSLRSKDLRQIPRDRDFYAMQNENAKNAEKPYFQIWPNKQVQCDGM